MGYLLGYARVSSTDQQPQLQVDALELPEHRLR
jgi:DNA invertase Pin-like site-specific DNA recombinase